ncbi:MAG: heavy metal translocating P-type ATPase [Phycisphaerales bacterium]|nr:heavy metal translocating P-type ATPase [Phycisphaerales bacterium]
MSANTVVNPEFAARSTEQVACAHCSLPVPAGLIEPGAAAQFCCHGCRTVYEVIHSSGLDRYYALRPADSSGVAPARTTGRSYAEFDDSAFREMHCQAQPGGVYSIELFLEGVHCAACVWLVEKLPLIAPGVVSARLELRRSLLRLTWDPGGGALSTAARALDSLGYSPHPARDVAKRTIRRREDARLLVRIGVAGAIAGNVMLLGFALYSGMFAVMEPQYQALFRVLSMVLTVVSLAWPGSMFFRGAWAAIRTRTAHLDLPIAIGLAAGGVAGVVNTLLGRGEIYFDSLAVLVFALLVGRWVQYRQQRWASDAVEMLYSLTPSAVRLIEGDAIREAPIEVVKRGDLVEVRGNETVPVDGDVVNGESSIDQSLLTGESRPTHVAGGDRVCAGTINISSPLRIRVTAAGEETRVGKLLRIVEECAARPAPMVRLADRMAGWFTAAVLALAAITVVVWMVIDPARAIDNATALLIVTCPCALGLTTPLAVTIAIGRAAKRGILIKGGDTLERLARPGRMILDKTGTLTQGRVSIVRWCGADWARPLVAAIESNSAHPVARAFVEAFRADADVSLKPGGAITTLGAGVAGRVGAREVCVGSAAWVRSRASREAQGIASHVDQFLSEGLAPVLVAVDGEIVAAAGVGDALRDDSRGALDWLRSRGWGVELLSGDHADVVKRVAGDLGIAEQDARGGRLPEQKLEYVRSAQSAGDAVMVGDGVNDAAALAAAHVGIAVHGGAEASLAAADVYLNRPGLTPIVELIQASRRTFAAIRRTLAISLGYNLTGAALAMTGILNPLIAAILMPVSSFTVLAMALGVRTFGGRR